MPIPKPRTGQSQSEYMAVCVPEMTGSGPDKRPNDQAVAACLSAWRDAKGGSKPKSVEAIIANWKKLIAKQGDDAPTPDPGEGHDDFVSRCVDELTADDPELDDGDAEDACELEWENRSVGAVVHKVRSTEGQGLEFILSDASVDRFGDIIAVEGWQFRDYARNPIALFNHDKSFPVGTWINLRAANKALLGDLVLAPKGISPRIDEIRGLVEAGVLRAVSVGFRPLEAKPIAEGKSGRLFSKSELVEVSLVSIPANANALAVAKSLHISTEVQRLVFREHANNGTGSASASARSRGEHARERTRALTGEHAKTRSLQGGNSMLLSKRVEDAEKFLVQLQDQLQEHLEKIDDSNVTDENMQVTEDLNEKIKSAGRNRDNLRESEQRLARSTDQRKELVTTTAFQPVVAGMVNGNGPRPFNMTPAKRLSPLDYLLRQGIVAGFSHLRKINLDDARKLAGYGDDEATKVFVDYAMRAATAPGMTTVVGWAAELVETIYGEFLQLLAPSSVMPRLAAKGLALSFGRAGRVVIPTRSATPSLAGSFVGEGQPIPVRQGAFGTITLVPKKLGVITSWTRELDEHSVPAIEGVLRDSISQDTGIAIDSVLLDTNPATAVRPPGLRSGVAGLTPTAGGGFNALVGDIKQLTGALLVATAGHIRNGVFLMNPQQILSISLTQAVVGPAATGVFPFADEIAQGRLRGFSVIESGNVPIGTVIFLDAADFVVVGAEAPRFEVSDQATIVYDDTAPTDIGTAGAPATVGAPAKSMFQTDSLALRLIWPLNWQLRRVGMVSWVANVTW